MTEYIILVMLSPFLNKGMKCLSDKELITVTVIFGCAVSVFPTLLPMFPWYQDESEMANFILLYLIIGCIKRLRSSKGNATLIKNKIFVIIQRKPFWIIMWVLSVLLLGASAFVLHRIAPAYEMYFYKYNGILVMLEAIAVFMVFLDADIYAEGIRNCITWVAGSSLVVYLVHMHPLFKSRYKEWGLFEFVSINSPAIYVMQICLTVLFVFAIGTVTGKVVDFLALPMSRKVQFVATNIRKE